MLRIDDVNIEREAIWHSNILDLLTLVIGGGTHVVAPMWWCSSNDSGYVLFWIHHRWYLLNGAMERKPVNVGIC